MGRILLLLIAISLISATSSGAQPVPVEVVQNPDGAWQLLRGGEPWFIKGAGGDGPKDLLAASGANTFRTWGVGPETGALLDEAHALGMTVVVGHWLGHPRHGFDYNDLDMVSEQFARVREDVLTYKDHPALLLWGIGNEMEGFAEGDDAAVWSHVQALAAMIKDHDPNHPTMTVTAEIGGAKVRAVHTICPDVDIMGINSYGGLPSVPKRYKRLKGTKPIVITEFGPPGTWEIGMTSFGAPPELTSTEKAAVYRDAFTEGCLDFGDHCLGGFAFNWGWKVEATATWYGMFLPNGDKLGAVDAMTEVWSGAPPANLCPEVRAFGLTGPDVVAPGDTVRATLDVYDPEGAGVAVEWVVRVEESEYLTGGDARPAPFELEGVVVESSATGATLVMPGGGVYRLYMIASDGAGAGAAANVPIMVDGPKSVMPIRFPVVVYDENASHHWAPSGWMGAYSALSMDPGCTDQPYSGDTCLKFVYDEPGGWVGVAWQHPANDWGDKPGGFDMTGATKLTFRARGAEGGEKIDFGLGLLGTDKEYHDSAKVEKKGVKLKKEWQQVTIDLKGQDLTRVKTPFVWTMGGRGRPVTFYLDDIRFE